jgi:enoyl-CoA hydratase/carnithine racemase
MTISPGESAEAGRYPAVVDYRVEAAVAAITICRPEAANALSSEVITLLRDCLERARRDRAVRVVVLTGAGDRAFSAGADLVGPSSPAAGASDVSPSELHEARGALAQLFVDLIELDKPSIARVRGYALAGGMGLALACDLVVASKDAIFGLPELDIGIWPYLVTVPLLRSLSPRRALELMLTGRRITAEEADRLGLLSRLVAPEDLDASVEELAGSLAAKPPGALAAGRRSFYVARELPERAALAYLHPLLSVATATSEAAEGRRAFQEKRPPYWRV